MKSFILKDKLYRKNFKLKEINLISNKFIFLDNNINLKIKFNLIKFWKKALKHNYFSKIKNRCIFSNRGSSIFSKLGISRIIFREFSSFGKLNGIKKASW